MTEAPQVPLSLDELATLLDVAVAELQALERAQQAAGSNSGIEAELDQRRARVQALRDRIRDFNAAESESAADLASVKHDPATVEAALAQIVEAHRPSAPVANAIRRGNRHDPLAGFGQGFVSRAGRFGAERVPPAAVAPAVAPSVPAAAAAPATNAPVPMGGIQLPNSPKLTITATPDGAITAVIERPNL